MNEFISGLMQSQRPALTVASFIATFFVSLTIGRWLKRRAGVQLNILFQLFCLALAFYTALSVYGLQSPWRGHVGAALVLLSAVFLISLVDRYLWDLYYEQKRQTVIPKFLRELVALVIFLIALLLVLSVGYHAERELKGLLAGSGVAAIILAFATQNLLGGMISGMSLQINKPYKLGDWLQVSERFAEVMEINWRSTRLRTNDGIYLDIPNNEIIRQTIVNLHYPTALHAIRVSVGADYNIPPNRVKDALCRATLRAEGVIEDPRPKVFLKDFGESSIIYEIKFYMGTHAHFNDVSDAVRTNVWYELRRQKINIPYPIRTLHVERKTVHHIDEAQDEAIAILRSEPLFQCLSDEQVNLIVKRSQMNHFGRSEKIIEEGTEGSSMFVLLRGTAQVSVLKDGALIRVGVLRSGDCFGEMSLLTGERRTATIRADGDCEVLEINKAVMADLLRSSPGCTQQLSELLARRKLETEGILKDAAQSHEGRTKEREYTANFLSRLQGFFQL